MNKTKSYAYNSILNSLWGIVASAITIILNFVVRFFLVRELGEEINGLNSLFQSIITMMALMEMGIGSAMIIHLYEPMKNKKYAIVSGILLFYRNLYRLLALAFFILGITVSFFLLDALVQSEIPSSQVKFYFIIFTCSISCDYLTYYKRSVLFADQRNRISSGATAVSEIVFRITQIVIMILFRSYILFLLLIIFEKITSNYFCSLYVNRNYPEINLKKNKEIGRDYKKAIFNTVKPLMVNQTASSIQNSSTSVLISLLLGNVSIVGYYGSYAMIIGVVQLIYSQFGSAFTTSFGNLAVDKDETKMKKAYFATTFLLNWFSCICCSAFLVCSSDFLYLFFGENFVLPNIVVWIMTVNLVLYLLSIPTISVQNAMGLHRLDAKYMLLQAILVFALGYLGGLKWGMDGILLGLTIPYFIFMIIVKGIYITKIVFGMDIKDYFIYIIKELIKIIFTLIAVFVICYYISLKPSVISVILKLLVATLVSIIIPFLLSIRSEFRKEIISQIMKLLS